MPKASFLDARMRTALLAAALYGSRIAAQAAPSHAIALVALEMYNKSPYVSLEVGRSSQRLLFLLNPASAPTYLDRSAATKLGLTPYAETAPGDSQPRQAGRTGSRSRAFSSGASTAPWAGPLLGGELLHRFNIMFDDAHHQVYFEPNRHLRDAFVFDMSGLSYTLTPDFHAIVVERVVDRAPGAAAGLRAGDIITAIDSTPVATLGLDTVLRIFEEPHVYELTVSRGTATFRVLLKLRKLL